MFGYVRVLEGELKINDFGLYRGIYCGLCKTMRHNTGLTSSFTLTYDFVLLALLRSGINNEGFTVRPGKCAVHPIKKRPIAYENESLRYCSAVAAVLTYYKLSDDKNDKDTKKRFAVNAALRQAKRNMKRAFKAFPEYCLEELSEKCAGILSELSELEASGSDSCDRCADAFGRLLSEVFSHCVSPSETADACGEIGYRVGRWIYITDLCDDFEKDIKSGAFNPIVNAGFRELPEEMLKATLFRETQLAYKALCRLNITYSDINNIIENILCLGMPEVVRKIFMKSSQAKPAGRLPESST